ncbi:MAG: response regulator [bacterium]|nr:response regulator [bacterium]
MSENKKVLIIEDEASLLSALMEKFKRKGFSVFGAKDGQEGLEAALKIHPDIILLDLLMPVMDGITMLRKLRNDVKNKEIRVLVLTNLSDVDKASEAAKLGAFDYIVKSDWKINDIVKRVTDILNKLPEKNA